MFVFEQCGNKIRNSFLTSLLEPIIVLSHTLLQRLWVTIVWMTEHCVFFFDTLLWLFQTDSTSVPWGRVTTPSPPLSSSSRHLLVSFGCREQKDRIWVWLIQETGVSFFPPSIYYYFSLDDSCDFSTFQFSHQGPGEPNSGPFYSILWVWQYHLLKPPKALIMRLLDMLNTAVL